jgi:hypothetical protein
MPLAKQGWLQISSFPVSFPKPGAVCQADGGTLSAAFRRLFGSKAAMQRNAAKALLLCAPSFRLVCQYRVKEPGDVSAGKGLRLGSTVSCIYPKRLISRQTDPPVAYTGRIAAQGPLNPQD